MSDTDYAKYCPICQRTIIAANYIEVEDGVHDSYIFVHDDIVHDDDDVKALDSGIN